MGGQKTMGAIHNEAFSFVKKNYGVMLVITLIITGIGIVLGVVSGIIIAPFSGLFGFFASALSFRFDASSNASAGQILGFILPMIGLYGVLIILSTAIKIAVGIVQNTAGVGGKNATLQLLGGHKPTFGAVWQDFIKNWKRYLAITAWSTLWVFLWGLLLIVPGYYKSLCYRLAPYLMIQYPDMKARDALKKSMEITQGYKGRLFGLDIIMLGYGAAVVIASFICCCLLPILPLAASLFWLPLLSFAIFAIAYRDIKQAAIEKGLLPPDPIQPQPQPEGGAPAGTAVAVVDSSAQQ